MLIISLGACAEGGGRARPDAGADLGSDVEVTDSAGEGAIDGDGAAPDALAVASIDPKVGPVGGGTEVTIAGTGFDDGVTVDFGAQSGSAITRVSAFLITVTTPPAGGEPGMVAVTVTNPDGDSVTVNDGFEYRAAEPTEVDLCRLQGPATLSSQPNTASAPVFGRVWEQGCTEGAEQCAGIEGQLGFGPATADPSTDPAAFTWAAASYNASHTGDDDEYTATLTVAAEGSYGYAYRFTIDGGASWTYCDLDGSGNNFSVAQMGMLTIEPGVKSVGWCTLHWPAQTDVEPGGETEQIYGRVFVAGCTEGDASCAEVTGELGYGPASTDPVTNPTAFTWVAASHNAGHITDDNDEYSATLTVPDAGSYAYAFRFSVDGGASWTHCDLDGSSNGFAAAQMGRLTVGTPAIDWCRLQSPPQSTSAPGVATEQIYGRVFVAGCSEGAEQCAEVTAQLGHGDPAVDPSSDPTAYTWVDASYNVGHTSDANDEYGVGLTIDDAGTYSYVYRFSLDGGTSWTYCDLDGSTNGFDPAQAGSLEVAQAQSGIGWCNLQWPAATKTAPDTESEPIFGQVYLAGCTDGAAQCNQITAQLGVGDPAVDASTSPGDYSWTDASYNAAHTSNNNDEYAATLTISSAGSYAYAYRFSDDGGTSWTYCDADGSLDGYSSDQAGLLTIAANAQNVGWCRLQSPATAATVSATPTAQIYGRVLVAGCTEGTAQCTDVTAQVGYASAGADPQTAPDSFSWVDATYNAGHTSDANDEYQAALTPTTTGSFVYAYRFSVDGGASWTYCDLDGSTNGLQPEQLGELTVAEPTVSACRLHYPPQATAAPGSPTESIYGRAAVAGCTDGAARCAGLVGQLGYGNPLTDPSADPSAFTWIDAGYNAGHTSDDEDEHQATIVPSAGGSYGYAYRFSVDGGASWTYCDLDGSENGFQTAQMGSLTATAPPIDWCEIQHPPQTSTAPGVATETIYGRVHVPGCTDGSSECLAVTAEVGYGAPGIDPQADPGAFTWSAATYNPAHTSDDNDEHQGTLTVAAAGTYSYAYRFSTDGGSSWTSCDTDGSDPLSTAQLGTLTVEARAIDWCNLQSPATITVSAGETTAAIYGRVHVPGCTDGASFCHGLLAELGYGDAGDDPSATPSSYTWTEASVNAGHTTDDNDEYEATLTPSTAGSYGFAFRFSGDGGASWTYCDTSGGAFSTADLGALTVQ